MASTIAGAADIAGRVGLEIAARHDCHPLRGVANYEGVYRLTYLRGPSGILVMLAQDMRSTSHHHIPAADEPSVPELETDETIPPRPEEDIANVLRAEPDLEDHRQHPE